MTALQKNANVTTDDGFWPIALFRESKRGGLRHALIDSYNMLNLIK